MKTPNPTHIPLAISVAGFLLAAGPLLGDQILFADTFNRADSSTTDGSALNESAAGKSGPLGALTWTGRTSLFTTGNTVDINNSRLRMAAVDVNGNNGGLAYISDHNFIDASIKTAGFFKVSMDISSVSSPASESRYLGFGIGQSLAELNGLASASQNANPADLYIAYDGLPTSTGIAVFHNGVNLTPTRFSLPAGTQPLPDTLSAVFTFADMNAGTQLNYAIFLDGIPVGTGSTTWDATDQNYISVTSNYSGPCTFENFLVIGPGSPVIAATVPMTGATEVQQGTDHLSLSFDEDVLAVGGKFIKIYLQDGTLVETIDASAAVISGGQVTIPFSAGLVLGSSYYVTVEAGAFTDLSGNPFAGIAGSGAWTFTVGLSDITYVDAVSGASGNTFATGGSLGDTSWVAADATTAIDDQWRPRAGVEGNGDTLFQAIPVTQTTPPPIPELTTTLNLANGTYNVWVFFWDQVASATQNWVISTGLTSGSLTTYSASGQPAVAGATSSGVSNAADLIFTGSPVVTAGSGVRNLFGVNLGPVEVTGGNLNIYVDMLIPGTGGTQRVWYDGVGYQLVANPAPADLAITSFTAVGGGQWDLALKGAAGGIYEFRSSTTLNFTPGTLVENLSLAGPGTIGGPNNSQVTTNGSGLATVRMNLGSGPKNFVRAQTAP